MPGIFKQWRPDDVVDLIDACPLSLVLSPPPGEFRLTPLPMLADADAEGRLQRLVGHLALRNPHVEILRERPRAWFLFQGPHGYVSPRLVGKPGWGPTWNYAVAWVEADVVFRPENNDAALRRLAAKLEGTGPEAWRVEDMGERYERLAQHVVAFDAEVVSVDATFKLGQDEQPAVFEEILAGLPAGELAGWMRRFRGRED